MEMPQEIQWSPEVWKGINDAVSAEVGKVRVCQQVFPTNPLNNGTIQIPNEVINLNNMSIEEGVTKQFVEIYLEFPLTTSQDKHICKTLARMAAKSIALAEDKAIFQGQKGFNERPSASAVNQTGQIRTGQIHAKLIASMGDGLLGEAADESRDDDDPFRAIEPIPVWRAGNARPGVLWGENTFTAVADGIAKLVQKAQGPEYALFLPTRVYADTFAPPGDQSLVTTADRIRPMVEGGFHGTGTLPPDRGLLVALAGEPISLFVGREAKCEYVRQDEYNFFFRVSERIQFVSRDPRALVLLQFKPGPDPAVTQDKTKAAAARQPA